MERDHLYSDTYPNSECSLMKYSLCHRSKDMSHFCSSVQVSRVRYVLHHKHFVLSYWDGITNYFQNMFSG